MNKLALVSLPGKAIDEATLKAIESAPESVENYAPLEERVIHVPETKLRRTTISLVHGTEMPDLTSHAHVSMRDKLYQAILDIQATGGGVELPFDSVGDDDDHYGVKKFNPNHDDRTGQFSSNPYSDTAVTAEEILGKKTSGQAGSIDGGVYEGTDGIKRYVKFYKEPRQALNERVANEVYFQLGHTVPNAHVFPTKGKVGFASEMMPNKGVLGNKYTPAEAQEVADGIATDILLGNRDVLGMGGTNLLRLNDGTIGRIDHGGALFYRALGVPKTPEALNNLQEIEGFFNPQYDMGRLMHTAGYTSLEDVPDIREQIDQIEYFGEKPDAWEKVVADSATGAGDKYDQKVADLLRLRASKLVEWRDNVMGKDLGYDQGLSGPPLEAWSNPPKTAEEWKSVEGQMPELQEPPFPKTWKKAGAGVIIREPDGRVWLVEPAKHFGGYKYTFPKGTQEDDLSLQQTAIKEAYEETGLKVKITGHFGDYDRDTSVGRYYTAERVGGHPLDHGWETAKVKLIQPEALSGYLNRSKDKEIAAHIVSPPKGVPSVPDQKPRPKFGPSKGDKDDYNSRQQSYLDRMFAEYYDGKKKFGKFNHEHYPAGTPGGLGGQFMPTGTPDEIITHLSPGVSSGSKLFNAKVKALHAAANHPTDPITAIANTPSYGKASHGYAKKFIALKHEAMAHAKASAEKVKPLPAEPPLWAASHQQAKWNNGTVKKLTAAAKGVDPMDAVAHVSIGATAKPFVKNYKDALMKHFAQTQGPVDWKQFLQVPSTTQPAIAEFPKPPATQSWMTNSHKAIKNVLYAAHHGSSPAFAVLNADVHGSTGYVKTWQKKLGAMLQKNPSLKVPQSLLDEHQILTMHATAVSPKPIQTPMPTAPDASKYLFNEADDDAVSLITHHGHAGNSTLINSVSTHELHPQVQNYKLAVLNYVNSKPTSATKLTANATNATNQANATGSKLDHITALEAHNKAKAAWEKEGSISWKQHHATAATIHQDTINDLTLAPAKAAAQVSPHEHMDYKYSAIQKPVDQLKEELAAKKAPLVLPEAPAVKTGIPEDQVKLYTDKIAKIKAAAYLSDPIASIDAIPGQSSSINAYKNAVKAAVFEHQGQKVKEIGDTVASLKLVGTGEPLYAAKFPTRVHKDFAQEAWEWRQALPTAEKGSLSSYQGSGHSSVNYNLRHLGNKQDVSGLETATKIKNLDSIFEKASLPMDTLVIRNIGNVEQLQLSAHTLVGHVVQDPAFMSSSLNGSFGAGLPVSLHLNVPKGSKALYLTSSGGPSANEHEVVIARRSLFRIDKVETTTGGYYSKIVVIHASMLPRHLQPKNT